MSKSFFTQEQLEKARQIDSAYALKILEVCVEYDDKHVEIPSTSHWLRKYVAGTDPDYVRCIAIPHGEWEFTKNKIGGNNNMPVRSITIGPCADIALAERGLRVFLREHQVSDIKVRRSDLPFRG